MAAKKEATAKRRVVKRPAKNAQPAGFALRRSKTIAKKSKTASVQAVAPESKVAKKRANKSLPRRKSRKSTTATRVIVAKPAKKKAAGTKPAARKAAKKPAKTLAAKKTETAPIAQFPTKSAQSAKVGGTASPSAAVEVVQPPLTLPAAWPFPMGNRS